MRRKLTDEEKAIRKIKMAGREVGGKKLKVERILPITDKYRLVSDTIEYQIQELTEGGKWKITGHHAFLEHAVHSLGNHVIKDNLDGLIFIVKQLGEIRKIVSDYEKLDRIRM